MWLHRQVPILCPLKSCGWFSAVGELGPFFFFHGSCHSLTNDCNKRLAQRSNSVMQRNSKALAGRCAANLTNKSSGAEESAPLPTHTPTLIYMMLQDCTLKLLELLWVWQCSLLSSCVCFPAFAFHTQRWKSEAPPAAFQPSIRKST